MSDAIRCTKSPIIQGANVIRQYNNNNNNITGK